MEDKGARLVLEMKRKCHGGRRPGAGRKPPKYPSRLIRIKCSPAEWEQIKRLGTRERAEVLLEAQRCESRKA